jgi:general secretion pathway protein I
MITTENNERGFTLMEILVAMMVLTISMTVIMQLFSGGLRSARLSEDYQTALFHARAKLENILLMGELSEGTREGEIPGGYRWQTKVTIISPDENKDTSLTPFHIDLNVSWQAGRGGKSFRLSTLQLAKKAGDDSGQ